MRIGIDARMYGPESTTGIGAYIKNLIEEVLSIDSTNEYVLFLKEPFFSSYVVPTNKVKKVKVDIPWYSLSEQIKFPKIILKEKLDLMHFPHFNAAIFYPKKFIVTVHDITPKFFPGPLARRNIFRRLGYDLVFRLSISRAKKIITISEHTKKNLIQYFKVDPKKIEITYLGVKNDFNPIVDTQQISKIKDKYKISKPYLLYIGVWRDHKNLSNLIKAFEIIKNKQPNLQLVLGGQADSRYPEIISAIEKSNFRKDIICPGFIDQADISTVYSGAEVFVLPSFCEGFGLVALEALACNTPVAASSTTSLPEILKGSAVYFNPYNPSEIAEAILKILGDSDFKESLKTGYLELKNTYQWSKTAQQTLDIYNKV